MAMRPLATLVDLSINLTMNARGKAKSFNAAITLPDKESQGQKPSSHGIVPLRHTRCCVYR